MVQVSMVVVGAGQRGAGYARWARRHPGRASVVGVAEPDAARRARFVAEHGIAAENAFCDWKELAERDRFADAVLICTQGRMHVEPVEAECPYSAPRFYGNLLERGEHRWPLSVLIDDFSPAALDEALRNGPYGRCVYACDNDVVDHQVVALEYTGATTATFTMTAFAEAAPRSTRLFGTRAELAGDGRAIRVYDFLTRAERPIAPAPDSANAEGHGGGDAGLMDAFTAAVATGDRALIKSGPRESLASHLAVLAAERSRLNGTVETIPPLT